MTKSEAIERVRDEEFEGPETYEEAAEMFAAIFGRAPAAEDDKGTIWSHCCAAVEVSS